MVMQETKEWWKSKTILVNGLVILGGLATAMADHIAAGGAITVLAVLNMFLRIITKAELE